ncbi:hypothetical protein Tco_0893742 [Tanacetum coccineum]|uniref:Uncharacterized protein n=1 Tax=Tanacetum coccineum TaxID=301880 RepID=A0ABQ5C9U5_9ASTR
MRANGANTVYMSFRAMIKDFTREDLIELYRLVMQKYGTNRPEDAYDRVLWSDLMTMFDSPLNEDAIWSLPLQQKIISWRYYDKCTVHCLTLEASTIYMLADRKYPLSKDACQVMLKMKLLDGTMDEVCYKLLKMIEKQAGIRNIVNLHKSMSVQTVFSILFAIELSKGSNSLQAEGANGDTVAVPRLSRDGGGCGSEEGGGDSGGDERDGGEGSVRLPWRWRWWHCHGGVGGNEVMVDMTWWMMSWRLWHGDGDREMKVMAAWR